MNKVLVCILLFFFISGTFTSTFSSVSASELVEDSWYTKTPIPQERWCMGVVDVEGKIYAIGGDSFSGTLEGINECYNPKTDKWSTLVSMPTWRAGFAIAVYESKIYCIGGAVPNPDYIAPGVNDSLSCDVVEVYDVVANSWSTKSSLPVKGSFIQAGVVAGKIFVLNGIVLFMYDPVTDVWTAKTSIPGIPTHPSTPPMAVVGDTLIAFEVGRVMIYDVKFDVWREGQAYSTSVYGTAVGVTSGVYAPKKVYILGSTVGNEMSNLIYDPDNDTWATATAMPTYRHFFGVAVVDDVLYAIGGATSSRTTRDGYLSVNEQYVPIGYSSTPFTSEQSINKAFSTESVAAAIVLIVGVTVAASLFFYLRKGRKRTRGNKHES
jgi:hypothetical protein